VKPNNGGYELCVEMFHETGQWNDASCDPYGIEKGYICKAPKSMYYHLGIKFLITKIRGHTHPMHRNVNEFKMAFAKFQVCMGFS
jgi:hypothetical protein